MSDRAGRIVLLDAMSTFVYEPFVDRIPRFFDMSLGELVPLLARGKWVEFELGNLSEDEFLRGLFHDRRDYDRAGLKACVVDAYAWIDGMQALMAELAAAGHQLHVLSNYPEWYHLIEDKLQVSRYARWTFVSCDTGVRKPDPRAYTGAAAALGVACGELVFVDDRAVNCDAARAVGVDAIQFTGASALRAELIARGFALAG